MILCEENTMTTDVPLFELVGPPCKEDGCDGVLWSYIDLKKKVTYKQCTTCKKQYYEVPLKDMLDHFKRTLERVLSGQKAD